MRRLETLSMGSMSRGLQRFQQHAQRGACVLLIRLILITAWVSVQMMQFPEAEADCNKALQRERTAKTLLRRATARRGMQDLEGARRDLKDALQLEPQNRCCRWTV